jgi:hypothetical protein
MGHNWRGLGRGGKDGVAPQAGTAYQTFDPPPWEQPIPLSDLPGVEPFPLAVLPAPLQGFVVEVARALNCPVDLVAVPLLGMASGAIGNSRHISITRSHHQPANLFAAVICRPGTAKSPAQRILRQPFNAAQESYLETWRGEMEIWKDQDEEDRGRRPVPRRCLVADTTTESFKPILEENGRGLLMVKDELMELVGGMNQYKGGKGNDRQFYLKLWDGEPIINDRKSDTSRNGAPLYIARPFASIVGGLQPAVLDRFRGESTRFAPPPDDGFLDRWLLTYPEDLPAVGETWLEVSDEALACWCRAVEWLLRLEMVEGEGHGPRPYFLDLTADARRSWQRFTEIHAAELNSADFTPHLRGPWLKLRGYCGRLALVLHCLRWACDRPEIGDLKDNVDAQAMEGAARLIVYFKSHARKAYAALDLDPRIGDARHVLGWLEIHPELKEFSRKNVHQGLRKGNRFNRPESLDAPLALLERHGYIRGLHLAAGRGPGRPPTDRYQRNPLWRPNNPNNPNKAGFEDNKDFEDMPGDAYEE